MRLLAFAFTIVFVWTGPRLSESEAEAEQPTGIEHFPWFILPLLLATQTMQFTLDRKQQRHKQNQCSAPAYFGLIFTRSYRSTLLITTPTTTSSLVKTSLKVIPVKLLESLSTRIFETRTATGKEHFGC